MNIFVYIRSDLSLETLPPTITGWRGGRNSLLFSLLWLECWSFNFTFSQCDTVFFRKLFAKKYLNYL